MKRLIWFLLFAAVVACFEKDGRSQNPPAGAIRIGTTQVQGGTATDCLTVGTTGLLNQAACGGGGSGTNPATSFSTGNLITRATTNIAGDNIGSTGFSWENKVAFQGGTNASGARVFIYDVSDNPGTATPVLEQTITPHEGASGTVVRSISVYGDFIHFISCSAINTCYYETFNYKSGAWLSSILAVSVWDDAQIVGNKLYLDSDGIPSLWVYDVSDWSDPKLLSSVGAIAAGGGIIVDNGYIYKGEDANAGSVILEIFSVDPVTNALASVGNLTYGAASQYNSTYLAKKGNYIFAVLGPGGGATCPCKQMAVIDVHNPATPTLAGTYQNQFEAGSAGGGNITGISIFGTSVLLGTSTTQMGGAVACLANDCGVDIIDISTPTTPTETKFFAFPINHYDNGMWTGAGKYLYSVTFDYTGATSNTFITMEVPGLLTPSADIGSLHVSRLEADEIVRTQRTAFANTGIGTGPEGIGSLGVVSASASSGNVISCSTYTLSNNGTNWTIATAQGTTTGAAIAAATTQAITLFALPARAKVTSTEQHTTTAWSGTGFTSITSKIQDSTGGAGFYDNTAYQLTTAVSNTNFQDVGGLYKSATFAGSNVQAFLTANQNLNANTITGVVDYTICWLAQP